MPSDGFYGPGAFAMTWSAVAFVSTTCPSAHPTATCYSGRATGDLPIMGRVTVDRMVAVGDGVGVAPSGCVTAETDGVISGATGALTFHATGLLCGRTSAYTVTQSRGSGGMSGYRLDAQIINTTSTETWSGKIAPA